MDTDVYKRQACFFGAISGSGPATVAALGAVLIPAMVEQGGFSAPFSTALMATSSSDVYKRQGRNPCTDLCIFA